VFPDSKHLNPGLQLYRASYEKNLPKMAEALAHGADVNWANSDENKATPLIQAVLGVGSNILRFSLTVQCKISYILVWFSYSSFCSKSWVGK
jgi:hypothetical protein